MRFLWLLSCLAVVFATRAQAEITDPAAQDALEPLRARMQAEPQNLDAYYAYAGAAAKAGKMQEAIAALEAMVKADPSLARVKLDLAMLYAKSERYEQAMGLLEEVLASNPPPEVVQNIESFRANIANAQRKHVFSGGAQVGVNWDSNANSAARSGSVTFSDLTIPLDASSTKKRDAQRFLSASLNHSYRFDPLFDDVLRLQWNNGLAVFRTEQVHLSALEVGATSLRTGPQIGFKDSGLTLGVNAIYNYITVAGNHYLSSNGGEARLAYAFSDTLSTSLTGLVEKRDFFNSASNSTITNSDGRAQQVQWGATYVLTAEDIFNISLLRRQERTQVAYLDNTQYDVSISYTRVLPWESFAVLGGGMRRSLYKEADPLVTLVNDRKDREYNYSVTLGKRLPMDLSWTVGYQYRNVDSTLQNYRYTNHRVSTALGWQF